MRQRNTVSFIIHCSFDDVTMCRNVVFVLFSPIFFPLSFCSRDRPLGDVRLSVWIAFNRLPFGGIVNLCSRTPILSLSLSHIRTPHTPHSIWEILFSFRLIYNLHIARVRLVRVCTNVCMLVLCAVVCLMPYVCKFTFGRYYNSLSFIEQLYFVVHCPPLSIERCLCLVRLLPKRQSLQV